jgi:hypothetical protein
MQPAALLRAALACGLIFAAQAPVDAQTQIPGTAKAPAPVRAPVAALPLEKPYTSVAVTIAAAPEDASFASFRQQLAGVAKDRVYAELARHVVLQGFFWDGDFSGAFDPKRSSMENFAAAIGLERGGGSGWSSLANFAAAADATPLPSRPGVICAPTPPEFDDIEFERLLDATQTKSVNWKYPRTSGVVMRRAPRPNSAAIETLGLYLIHLLGYEASESDPARTAWARVAASSGKVGFVAPATLMPLRTDRLCYSKDVTGRWRIAGYVAAGD